MVCYKNGQPFVRFPVTQLAASEGLENAAPGLTASHRPVHGLRSTAQCRLHVVQCDTKITQVNTPDPHLNPEDFRGRGGTDFRPVFEWIREKVLPVEGWPDLLAYLTDAEGQFPENLPAYPVVWLLPQRVKPPFGMKIEIPPH